MLIRRNFLKSLLAGGYLLNNHDVSTANEFYKLSKSKTTFQGSVNITAIKWKWNEITEYLENISCFYGPEFPEANIDTNFPAGSIANKKIKIDENLAYFNGTGANSIIDYQSESLLKDYMQCANAVIISPGMRGGAYMEAIAAISRIAREMEVRTTIAVVPTPCFYKNHKLCLKLDKELSLLKKQVDCCVHVPIADSVARKTPLSKAFPDSEDGVRLTVQAITDSYFTPDTFNSLYNYRKSFSYQYLFEFTLNKGQVCSAVGVAGGKDRAELAAHQAVRDLKRVNKNTKSLLLCVTGDKITSEEYSSVYNIVWTLLRNSHVDLCGVRFDPRMTESMRVTLIGADISDY